MFSLPVGENIAASSKVDEERAWEVLEEVELAERVRKMKDSLKTQLYNNNGAGVDVSGGEAQRLAIARALYKDAPFVILDEPTAALDPIAEAQIYENFNEMVRNKTAIYISHRMSSCKFCDRIVVLDAGNIAEMGTHDTLLAENGIYARLYQTQAQYYA
jgi:ATP-binding cassette subfamily B protein